MAIIGNIPYFQIKTYDELVTGANLNQLTALGMILQGTWSKTEAQISLAPIFGRVGAPTRRIELQIYSLVI